MAHHHGMMTLSRTRSRHSSGERSPALVAAVNRVGYFTPSPSVEGHDRSSHAYVAYSYVHVYAQRRITPDVPPEQVPVGFEELRQEILGYSKDREEIGEGLMGLFIVFTDDRPSPDPLEVQERDEVSVRHTASPGSSNSI